MSLLRNSLTGEIWIDGSSNASSNLSQSERSETQIRVHSVQQRPQAPPWLEDMTFVMMGVFGPIWEIPGLITSALSIVLLKLDKSVQSSVRIILIALAVADVLFLVGTIFCVQLDVYAKHIRVGTLHTINRVVQSPACSVVNIAEMFRNWLTVLIGIERFIATSFPLSARRLCSTRRVWLAIVIIFAGSVLLRVPYAYRRWLRDAYNMTQAELKEHKVAELAQTIHTNVDSYGLVIIPLIILTVLSVLIIRKMNLSHSLHSNMRKESQGLGAAGAAAGKLGSRNKKSNAVQVSPHSSFTNSSETATYNCTNTGNSLLRPAGGSQSVLHGNSHSRCVSRHEHRRNQVAIMLLIILLLFAVFGIPQIIFVIIEYLRLPKAVRSVMVITVWTSSLIYSNTNFFVYIAYMSKYRQMLRVVVCKCACTYDRLQHFCAEESRKQSRCISSTVEPSLLDLPSVNAKAVRKSSAQHHALPQCMSFSSSCTESASEVGRNGELQVPTRTVVRHSLAPCSVAAGNAEGNSSIKIFSTLVDE